MVLAASDELRHPHDALPNWRESVYFNFADAANGLGGWIYLWVVPNKPNKSGMLVSVYKGITDRVEANDLALNSPDHCYRSKRGTWVYCFKQDVAPLLADDFDAVELCGLRLVRTEPLKSYEMSFEDDRRNRLELKGEFTMPPYDYADGKGPTPPWLAQNRYHRSWRVSGTLTIAGTTYKVNATGDSDHSWGNRDMQEFSKNRFKMWSFQTPSAHRSVSVIDLGEGEQGVPLGFVDIDGEVRSVARIGHSARYSKTGVQQDIQVVIEDTAKRVVRASMSNMFAALGHGEPFGLWGFEGVGAYQVDDWGVCTGVASYFWPPSISGESLHSDL